MKSLEPSVVVGDRYVLVRPLAKGGMGSVWIARHRELDVDVTLKFMMPALVDSPELRARFEREAKVAARLRSQHVVQVLDFGIDDGMPYIAMELLQGENLADRLKRETRLSLSRSAQILSQICKALRTAHEAGLVHRDLKPGNIFLALKDGEEVVKVLDFGIVKDTAKSDTDETGGATDTGVMMGSVHYMSPEQIRSSRQVDHRSDLWSVGVILYKMLTGNAPFPGSVQGDVMVRVCTDAFPPPSAVVPGLSPAIDAFFARALTRDPAARFQSAQEMADAFLVASSSAGEAIAGITRGAPPPQWTKTLPLVAAEAAREASLGSASRAAPSDAGDTGMGTFQAVTVPQAPMASAVSAVVREKPPSVARKGLLIGVGAGVLVLSAILFFLVRPQETPAESLPQDATSAAPLIEARSSAAALPAAPVVLEPIPSALPSPSSPATTPPTVSQAKPPGTAPTVPKTSPKSRQNPLDIND